MSMFGIGGMGGFGGRFDENLSSKIDQLVGNQTKEQKLEAQLREMGIDPDKLPLKPEDAKRHVEEFLRTWEGDFDEPPQSDQGDDLEINLVGVEFVGSSLGFSRIVMHGKATDYDSYRDDTDSYPEHEVEQSVTKEKIDDEKKWRELERVWEALKEAHGSRFKVWGPYTGHDDERIQTVVQKFHKSPKRLREGQTARLEKDGEVIYAKMGGLWGDDVLTNLRSMQPITESGWVVTEIVED